MLETISAYWCGRCTYNVTKTVMKDITFMNRVSISVNSRWMCVCVSYLHLNSISPSSTVQSKDLQGHPYTLKNVCIRFSDPQLEPTPPTKLQTILSDAVKNGMLEGKQPLVRYGSVTTNGIQIHVHVLCSHTCGDCIDTPTASTPWYDGYRNIFLEKRRQEDREPIRHYVSGIGRWSTVYMYIILL